MSCGGLARTPSVLSAFYGDPVKRRGVVTSNACGVVTRRLAHVRNRARRLNHPNYDAVTCGSAHCSCCSCNGL